MPTGYGIIDTECGLKINDLDAARFTLSLQMGPLAVKQYQYVYVQEDRLWVLSLAVDDIEWSEYEPIFVIAAESFRVG